MEWVIGSTTRPYNALSFAEACERIACAGYTDVAVFAHNRAMPVDSESSATQVADAKNAATQAGLKPSMLLGQTRLDRGVEGAVIAYQHLLDNAAELGAKWILELGTGKEAHYGIYPEVMRQAAEHAETVGVGISLKPHGGISLTAKELIDLYHQVDRPAFAVSYDPGNIIHYTRGDVRPEQEVDEIAPYTSTAIVKDCALDAENNPNVNTTAGDGEVDFYRVLSGLVRGGFKGPLYVECVGSKEHAGIDRDLAFTLGYIKGILSGL